MGLSTSSFFCSWARMELNILAFLIWGFSRNNKSLSTKYFFIQAFYSTILFSAYMLLIIFFRNEFLKLIITIVVLGKLGLPPLFLWFINLASISSFQFFLLISTIQKIIPIFILSHLESLKRTWFFLSLFICLGGIIKQVNIKKVLSYSSIFNFIWILAVLNNFYLIVAFFFAYTINFYILSSFLVKGLKIENRTDYLISKISRAQVILLFLRVCRMSGIPPFVGFNFKILIMSYIIESSGTVIMLIIVLLVLLGFIFTFVYLIIIINILFYLSNKISFIYRRSTSDKIAPLAILVSSFIFFL